MLNFYQLPGSALTNHKFAPSLNLPRVRSAERHGFVRFLNTPFHSGTPLTGIYARAHAIALEYSRIGDKKLETFESLYTLLSENDIQYELIQKSNRTFYLGQVIAGPNGSIFNPHYPEGLLVGDNTPCPVTSLCEADGSCFVTALNTLFNSRLAWSDEELCLKSQAIRLEVKQFMNLMPHHACCDRFQLSRASNPLQNCPHHKSQFGFISAVTYRDRVPTRIPSLLPSILRREPEERFFRYRLFSHITHTFTHALEQLIPLRIPVLFTVIGWLNDSLSPAISKGHAMVLWYDGRDFMIVDEGGIQLLSKYLHDPKFEGPFSGNIWFPRINKWSMSTYIPIQQVLDEKLCQCSITEHLNMW